MWLTDLLYQRSLNLHDDVMRLIFTAMLINAGDQHLAKTTPTMTSLKIWTKHSRKVSEIALIGTRPDKLNSESGGQLNLIYLPESFSTGQ